MHGFLEIISWMIISSVKFLFTPSAMIASGYSFWQTATITMAGGSLGVLVFYYAGEAIFLWWKNLNVGKKRKKKFFSKRNRIIVRYMNQFGIIGLAACIGVLSVPLCSLLAARYFYHKKSTIILLICSVIVWSFLLTGFSYLVRFIFTF